MSNIKVTRENRYTILQEVVESEDCCVEKLNLILDKGARLSSDILNIAVLSKYCKIETIKWLIEKRARLNNKILRDAVISKQCDCQIIQLLLESGAKNRISVLVHVLENRGNDFALVKLLIERKTFSYKDSIQVALEHRATFEIIKLLFENGCEIRWHDLHWIVRMVGVDIKIWKYLIQNGAKVTLSMINDVIEEQLQSIDVIKLLLVNAVAAGLKSRILFPTRLKNKGSQFNIELIKLLLDSSVKPETNFLEYIVKNHDDQIELLKLILNSGLKVSIKFFKSCKINSSNICFFKILLQYMFIEWFQTERVVQKKCMQYVFLKKSNFEHLTLYQNMDEFFDCLINDLTKMKNDLINQNFSLFSFISDRCSIYHNQSIEYDFINKILSKFCSGNYVCCRDLMYASFSKDNLLCKISKMDIYAKNNSNGGGKKVSLIGDIKLYLASFLTKDDIINLILAFWHEKNPIL